MTGDDPPPLLEEIFAWSQPRDGQRIERTALIMRLRQGREPKYREWLAGGALPVLETVWRRNQIWRHDVLLYDTTIVANYQCADRHNVLTAFGEPESLELLPDLGKILVLDTDQPMVPFVEKGFWSSGR